ncbi:hypothetical protein B0H14DRAFT_3477621 [Mycena olivaceomarginata]|nr:hypothetical protein B0H14DRAFT_3477621 [Mycena olivaceomarginata]
MTDPPDTSPSPTPSPTVASSTSRPPYLKPNLPNLSAEADETTEEAPNNVTKRRTRPRQIPPLETDAHIISPPRPTAGAASTSWDQSPHKPAPQIRVVKQITRPASAQNTQHECPPDVTMELGVQGAEAQNSDHRRQGGLARRLVTSGYRGTPDNAPKGKRTSDNTKKEKYTTLLDEASASSSLDELSGVLKEALKAMKGYGGAPTKACFAVLEKIQEKLENHHKFPSEDESKETFSSVLSRLVSSPVKSLMSQIEAQNRAIQSLSKTVESLKNAPLLSPPPSAPAVTMGLAVK